MNSVLVKRAKKEARNYYKIHMETGKIPPFERRLSQALGIGILSAFGGGLGYTFAKKKALRGRKALVGALIGAGVGLMSAPRFPKERTEVVKLTASTGADTRGLLKNLGLSR